MAKTKRQILNELLSPIVDNRRSGKTTLLKMGIDNYDKPFALICRSYQTGKEITSNPNCLYVTPFSLDSKDRLFTIRNLYTTTSNRS
jgi:hypothetical protein